MKESSQEKLKLSESRYRSLVSTMSEIVWTCTAEGFQITDFPEWQSFTGQTAEELAGLGWADAIHPDDRERTLSKWKESVATGRSFEIEQRLRHRNGDYRVMLVRAVPVRDDADAIVEWVGMHTDITEQRKLEEALRRSTDRFQKLFESDLMGIGIPNRFGGFSEANDELLRTVGYTREDLESGRVRWDIMTPPEYAALDAAHIAEAAQRGSCTPYEKEYIRKDGTRVPILCGYALLEGSHDEYIGFVQDLSTRKQTERGLFEANQRLNELLRALPIGVSFSEDSSCEHISGNPAAVLQFEVVPYDNLSASAPNEDAPGRQVKFFYQGTPVSASDLPLQRAVAEDRQVGPVEFEVHLPSGRRWIADCVGAPLHDADGKVAGGVAVTVDVTERKQLQEGLREREQRFHALAESLPQLIWVADAQGRNTYCNRRFLEYTGVSPDDMMA